MVITGLLLRNSTTRHFYWIKDLDLDMLPIVFSGSGNRVSLQGWEKRFEQWSIKV